MALRTFICDSNHSQPQFPYDTLLLRREGEKQRYVVHQLTGTEKTQHVVIGKLTAIVGHCELLELELEAESQQSKERLERIKSLTLDIAEMVLTCTHQQYEHTEEQRQLTV